MRLLAELFEDSVDLVLVLPFCFLSCPLDGPKLFVKNLLLSSEDP